MAATQLLPSTVRGIRLKQKLCITRGQSHPRRIPGFLTVPQLATLLDVSPSWLYERITKGAIQIAKDSATGLYLCPDTAETREQGHQCKDGHRPTLCFVATRTQPNASPASPGNRSEGCV